MFLIEIEKKTERRLHFRCCFLKRGITSIDFFFFLSFLDSFHHFRWVCIFHPEVAFSVDQYAYK